MVRRFGAYILGSPLHAGWVALVCAAFSLVLPPAAWLGFIILGLVTLRVSLKAGIVVLCWILIPGIIWAIMRQPSWLVGLAVNGGLVLILGCILRRYSSWSYVLEIASLLGIVGILAAHGVATDLTQWWFVKLHAQLQNSNMVGELGLSPADVQQLVKNIARFATGFWAALVLLSSILELLVARWWQATLYNPGGLRQEFYQIRISKWLTVVLIAAIAGALFRYTFLADLLPVAVLPFVFAGLSLIHFVTYVKKITMFLLVSVYVVLFLFPQLIVGVLVMIALVDSWINLRQRLKKN